MKNVTNISKKVFLMVALMATVLGYANDGSFLIRKTNTNKTVLTLNDVKVGNLFSIKDANGLVLYKETIQTAGLYIKGFNLTSLPNGEYTFELDKDMEVKSIPFSVLDNEVDFERNSAEAVVFKPSTILKDNMIYVTKLALSKAPLVIEVYYDEGEYKPYKLLHRETIEANAKKIERAYKLDEDVQGTYKIVYKTEGKQFIEYLVN
jgi:hypothetical protein